jgi:predicted metal-dependent hydrolase
VTQTLPTEFWQGVEQFNHQEFYACHDTLEALWMEAIEPLKTFYQGVLQIAVALYHLSNHNWRGSVILLGEGINRLRYYQPAYADVDVAQFLTQSAELLTILQQMGPERVVEVAQTVMQVKGNGSSDIANIPMKSIKISRYPLP